MRMYNWTSEICKYSYDILNNFYSHLIYVWIRFQNVWQNRDFNVQLQLINFMNLEYKKKKKKKFIKYQDYPYLCIKIKYYSQFNGLK